MKKQVKTVFELSSNDIEEAFYDYYVRKLKSNGINAVFNKKDIKILTEQLEVYLTISEDKDLQD